MKHELIQYVKRADITVKEMRIRMAVPAVQSLAASMAEVGLQQPIRLRWVAGVLVIIDGERRFLAAGLLGWEEIAAIVEEGSIDDARAIQQGLIANIQRKGLNGPEIGHSAQVLMRMTGWTATEVAKRLGVSKGTISKILALLKLPEPIQEKIESGQIAPKTAYEFTKLSDPKAQGELARAAANGELTADDAAAVVAHHKQLSDTSIEHVVRSATAKLAEGRTLTLRGPALTLDAFVDSLQSVLAQARTARRKGLDLRTFLKRFHGPGRCKGEQ